MFDTWLKNDLEQIYERHRVAVFIDESGEAQFALSFLDTNYQILQAHCEIDELQTKYLIEKEANSTAKYLIYTTTPRNDLKFIREYCETNGCVEIKYLQNYIKEKVHKTLNLNINLPIEELITAAKMSVGQDRTYWMDVSHKGAGEIFALEKELLVFIHDPKAYAEEKGDAQLLETFYRKVNEHLGQDYVSKPPATLAAEVVRAMLDGLAHGQCDPLLKKIYCSWLDSLTYKSSFPAYLGTYKLPDGVDIWNVSPSHPFRSIDEQWLKEIGENLGDKERFPDYLTKIKQRLKTRQAHSLEIGYWKAVETLLAFDGNDIAFLSSFEECVEFYTRRFYVLDGAIRNLYTRFMHKKDLLQPFQEYYKNLVTIFLDKWFQYFKNYQENQAGALQCIIDENSGKTAVIVGDGITFEFAKSIAGKVARGFDVSDDVVFADIPSETEVGMSRIYMDNGVIEPVQAKRESYLTDHNQDQSIEFLGLDEVSDEARAARYLICTSKDIDSLGEKLQHKALKYFTESESSFAKKIEVLLRSGYQKVYLISDHGFVLTGILAEADKIAFDFSGSVAKSERYVRTVERQKGIPSSLIEIEQQYGDFNYIYFSTTMNPFKTPGVYGYSHGGLSPQELIIPFFCWENPGAGTAKLSVDIQNKGELAAVTGEIFQIQLKAAEESEDLFSLERKVYMVFFSGGRQVSKSDIFAIKRGDLISKDYSFDGLKEIEVQLLDADTKEQLDRVRVKRKQDRDLGGLL